MVEVVRKNLDRGAGVGLGEDEGVVGVAEGGALDVVRVADGVGVVEGGLALGVTGGQNLDDVELAATGLPARAVVVLAGTGDLAVQHPGGGLVLVEARLAVVRHGNLEGENFIRTLEALVSDSSWAVVTASGILVRARLVGEDSNLRGIGNQAVLEYSRRCRTLSAILAEVRQRVAPGPAGRLD